MHLEDLCTREQVHWLKTLQGYSSCFSCFSLESDEPREDWMFKWKSLFFLEKSYFNESLILFLLLVCIPVVGIIWILSQERKYDFGFWQSLFRQKFKILQWIGSRYLSKNMRGGTRARFDLVCLQISSKFSRDSDDKRRGASRQTVEQNSAE